MALSPRNPQQKKEIIMSDIINIVFQVVAASLVGGMGFFAIVVGPIWHLIDTIRNG